MRLFEHFWERFSERITEDFDRRKIKKEIEEIFDQRLYYTILKGKFDDGTNVVAFYWNDLKCLAVRRHSTGDLITILPQNAIEYDFDETKNAFLKIWNEVQRRKYLRENKRKLHKQKSIIVNKPRLGRKPMVHTGSSIFKKSS